MAWSDAARAAALAVRRGQKGTREVRAVQRKVGVKVDADFGEKTEKAVRRFQRKHGLQVDGVVGRQTAAAMNGNKNAASLKPGEMSEAQRARLASAGRARRNGRRETAAATKTATATELKRRRERQANRSAARAARKQQSGYAARRVKSAVRGTLTEEEGKPGTNWKQVKGEDRKRINPIVRHYMKMAHPFTACVRDNTKRFGPDRAKRICAVVKDMGERSTKWRNSSGLREDVMADYWAGRLLEAADGDVEGLEMLMLSYIAEREVGT